MIKDIEMANKIAHEVSEYGGRAYYVGGFIRDKLMGIESDKFDVDIEIHGISEEKLYLILKELGNPISIGKSFGIMSLENYNIDIAMPRREVKIGDSHTDFEITIDENMGTYDAAKRRDFTINSIMQDILTEEIIDHFDGIKDINNKIIRHVNDKTFIEDSLRVLRACQFASRFGFGIDEKTMELCKKIDLSKLSKERIFYEVVKVFQKSKKPSIFFREMDKINHLGYWFKELENTKFTEQSPIYHSEGNVFEHTMLAIDVASSLKDKVKQPINFMFAVLCHDLGKSVTTKNIEGKISSIHHDIEGVEISKTFLKRFTNNRKLINYVANMVELHMRPNMCVKDNAKIKTTNKMFDLSVEPNDLIYVSIADNLGRISKEPLINTEIFLLKRLEEYNKVMSIEHVTGHDLINSGIKQGKIFSELMKYAHNLRLSGINKEKSLKQTLAYARELEKR
ncbi:CCA tRNA nucleotidyltransferase [Oceanivirga salmonicida]|uniref:CCA tRNA nucleotidyltransferase n=1 Tax=Oceanivirga salmonicida TaxID=1769291 RepID=UPI000835363B|nr:HD domain-containing protein [Oceanivirga salmonicida]